MLRAAALFFCLLATDVPEPQLNLTHTTSFVCYAADANHNTPMIFGGKLLSEMDRCAGITARRLLYASPNRVRDAVTVGITDVRFVKGAKVKDLLFVTGEVKKIGEKSITVHVKVEKETVLLGKTLIVEGTFVFVAYDLEKEVAVEHGITKR